MFFFFVILNCRGKDDEARSLSGTAARLAMFSLRFDNGPIEAKFRRIHQLLMPGAQLPLEVDVGMFFLILRVLMSNTRTVSRSGSIPR